MVFVHTKTVSNQVDEILLERIREGMYLPGIRMPSESELSDEFGVSRATVRTALAKLAASGIILRKQGDGEHQGISNVVRLAMNDGSLTKYSNIK